MKRGRTTAGVAGWAALSLAAFASHAAAAPAMAVDPGSMPDGERQFIAAVEAGRDAFRASVDDAGRKAARADRAKAFCAMLRDNSLVNWRGRLDGAPATKDGAGILSVALTDDIHLVTASTPPQAGDNGLIAADSPLFARIAGYKDGDVVNVSGLFPKGAATCIAEPEATPANAMLRPSFVFTFTDVTRSTTP